MKNLFGRFAIMAVVGTLLCSAFVVGCGGGDDDATNTSNTTNTTSTTTK